MKTDLTIHRRTILAGVAAWGTVTFLPYAARAETHASDVFPSQNGVVEVSPISHASFVLKRLLVSFSMIPLAIHRHILAFRHPT